MSGLEESLRHIMSFEGVRAVALIDIATGMIVRCVGELAEGFPVAAASLAGEARAARAAFARTRPVGHLEEIFLVTTDRLHVSRILDSRLGEGLLLFVDVDRARANIALASLRIGQAAPAVLA